MNDETKTMNGTLKTKTKMEVLMKKTTILAVVMIVAQGAFAAAPGAKPAHLRGKGTTESAMKAMGLKQAETISADEALRIAKEVLRVDNESLVASKMTDGFIKLIQLAGEAQRSTNAADKEFAASVKLIAENVGKIEEPGATGGRSLAEKTGKRMLFEVLPDLINEGSVDAKALVINIGKQISGGEKLAKATLNAVKETYGIKDDAAAMKKVNELYGCQKA